MQTTAILAIILATITIAILAIVNFFHTTLKVSVAATICAMVIVIADIYLGYTFWAIIWSILALAYSIFLLDWYRWKKKQK